MSDPGMASTQQGHTEDTAATPQLLDVELAAIATLEREVGVAH